MDSNTWYCVVRRATVKHKAIKHDASLLFSNELTTLLSNQLWFRSVRSKELIKGVAAVCKHRRSSTPTIILGRKKCT
jgi:hypothetical protein